MDSRENRHWLCLTFAIVAMLLLFDSGSSAQQIASSWTNLEQSKGRTVVVMRDPHHAQTGELEQTSADTLTINTRGQSVVIRRDDIREIYTQTRRSRKRGALWGLAFGAGGGAVVGAAAFQPCKSGSFCISPISRGEGAAIGAVAGAAVGTLVGTLVGGGHKKVLLFQTDASASH